MKTEVEILRAKVRDQRRVLASSELRTWNGHITDRVLNYAPYQKADSIALYSPVENEVDTDNIRDDALLAGKKVFYPKLSQGDSHRLVRIRSPKDMEPGCYGIPEPLGDEVLMRQVWEGVVIFIPGLAFDSLGNRLGRGSGWYDRTLNSLGEKVIRIALAFEFQIVVQLSTEAWDEKVHEIVTEKRVIHCRDLESHKGTFS